VCVCVCVCVLGGGGGGGGRPQYWKVGGVFLILMDTLRALLTSAELVYSFDFQRCTLGAFMLLINSFPIAFL
jgi:hypothetical protein